MSTIPAKEIERNRDNPGGRNLPYAPPANHDHDGEGTLAAGAQEANMLNRTQHPRNSAAKRCAVCEGKFGLIRHYSWRNALCSRKCADRFKTRLTGDRRWLLRCDAA